MLSFAIYSWGIILVNSEEIVRFIITNNQRISDFSDSEDDKLAILTLKSIVMNMTKAADIIDCPYCARHMRLEAEELDRVIKMLEGKGNIEHSHGLGERLATLLRSFKITFYIILGGLKRAGVIR